MQFLYSHNESIPPNYVYILYTYMYIRGCTINMCFTTTKQHVHNQNSYNVCLHEVNNIVDRDEYV